MEHRNSTVHHLVAARWRASTEASCSRQSRTSSFTAGTSSAFGRAVARAVRFRAGEHVGRSLARRRLHAVLRPARAQPARASSICATRPHAGAARRAVFSVAAHRSVRSAEEMSQMAPFTTAAGPTIAPTGRDLYFWYYPYRRRDRAGPRPDAARTIRRTRLARRFHACDVARFGKPGRTVQVTSIGPTRARTPRRRWPRSVATARSRATSSRATFMGARSRIIRVSLPRPALWFARRAVRAWLGDLTFVPGP